VEITISVIHVHTNKWVVVVINRVSILPEGTRYRNWLRHYATSRKVVGSIPKEATGVFQFT
jgi:hypothetical protein